MVFDLLVWWYKEGWVNAWRSIPRAIKSVLLAFSLPVLLRTLFSPWKQIISGGGRSIDEKLRSLVDNLVSRSVGFVVRLGVIAAALIIIVAVSLFNLALAIAWPVIPLSIIYFILRGILR